MNLPELPWEGGCRCGKVRFRITRRPLLTMVCHCTGCQRMSASAFSTSIAIPTEGFEILGGETVIGGIRDPQARHHHCDHCKSWLCTTFDPTFVNVRATMLDDARWFEPFVETYTSEALPWAKTPARHSFEKFPAFDVYRALIAEFTKTITGS